MLQAFLMSLVGIIISYIVINYVIPLAFPMVYKLSAMKNRLDVTKVSLPLTLGSCNFDSSSIEINTSNPYREGFVFMPNSNNLKGGSQFSYSFWLDIKSNYETKLSKLNIFMRGNNSKSKGLLNTKNIVESTPDIIATENDIPLVVCPLVRFVNSDDRNDGLLEIIFNTMKNPHNKIIVAGDVYHKIMSTSSNPKWFLITIVFQDFIDFSNSEKGVQIQHFVNDNLVSTKIIKNDSLRLNNGNIYLTPFNESTDDRGNSFYADLVYYNYALDIIEIQNIYNRGITEGSTGCVTAKYSEKKSDMYNTLGMNAYL